jgi:soluble lytic murein transglycosylase-like protein
MPQVAFKVPEPTETQVALIKEKAEQYNVSAILMTKIISCESGFNERALGDSGYSRGLVQIHSKYHPTITDEQAYDAEFAVTFLAEKLSEGDGHLWTCFRILSGSS